MVSFSGCLRLQPFPPPLHPLNPLRPCPLVIRCPLAHFQFPVASIIKAPTRRMRIRIRIAAAVGRHSLESTPLASPSLCPIVTTLAHTYTHAVARICTLVCAGGKPKPCLWPLKFSLSMTCGLPLLLLWAAQQVDNS